jgi:hypothetical protein
MKGWIKLHRKLTDWEWYDHIPTYRLFTHLLLTVNHVDKKWRGQTIKAGSRVAGRLCLSAETGLTQRQVRTAIKNLETTREVTREKTSKGTVFTIVSWGEYQETTSETTKERPTNDQQTTSKRPQLKNDKNIRSKEIFKEQVFKYSVQYSFEMLNDFFLYWSEKKPNGKKMKWEMERTWDLNLRLQRWSKNEKKFNGSKTESDKPKTRIEQLARRHGISN